MVGPKVRFGTKWLSMTSTWIQSELGTRASSAPRAAKSAVRMLGVIWMPTHAILGRAPLELVEPRAECGDPVGVAVQGDVALAVGRQQRVVEAAYGAGR